MRKSVPFVDFGSVSGEALKRANLTFLPIGDSSFFFWPLVCHPRHFLALTINLKILYLVLYRVSIGFFHMLFVLMERKTIYAKDRYTYIHLT